MEIVKENMILFIKQVTLKTCRPVNVKGITKASIIFEVGWFVLFSILSNVFISNE